MITLHEVKANGKVVYRGPNRLIALQTKKEHERRGETVEMESDIPYTGQPIGEEIYGKGTTDSRRPDKR